MASPNRSPPTIPTLPEVEALKEQVATLTQQNTDLKTRIADAEGREKATIERAQTRYTEKVHANRNVERLEKELAEEKWERQDDQLKAVRAFTSLKENNTRLEKEKASGQWTSTDGAQLQEYQNQIMELQTSNQSCHNENKRLCDELAQEKASSMNTIKNLQTTIEKLQTELATEQVKSTSATNALGPEELKARIHEATEGVRKRSAMAMQQQKNAIHQQMQQQFVAFHKQKMEEKTQQFKQSHDELLSKLGQLGKSFDAEKHKTVTLEQQIQRASQEVQWYKQLVQTPGRTAKDSPQQIAGKHAAMPMTPEQRAVQIDLTNKRRRLDSGGAFGIPTPNGTQSQQAMLQPLELNANQSADLQEVRGMLFQNMVTQSNNQTSPTQFHAMSPNGMNGMQTTRQPNGQQRSQPSPFRRQAVSPATVNNGLQMSQMNSKNMMQGSPSMQPTMLNAQQPKTSNGNFRTPAAQEAFYARMRQQALVNQQNISQGMNGTSPRVMSQQMRQGAGSNYPSMPPQPMMNNSPIPPRVMPSTQSQSVQLPSSPRANGGVQTQNTIQDGEPNNKESHGRYSPTMESVEPFPDFDPAQWEASNTKGSRVAMETGYRHDDWYSENMPCMGLTGPNQMVQFPTTTANETPRVQNGNAQQPKQHVQHHHFGPSLLHSGSPSGQEDLADRIGHQQNDTSFPQLIPHGIQNHPTAQQPQQAMSPAQPTQNRPAPAPAPSRSTPAPRAKPTHLTPAPSQPSTIACVNCYRHWWEDSCDGQPCSNCQQYGAECSRPKCVNFAAGTCDKPKCKMVHENDPRYYDETYLVEMSKLPKRLGRKVDAQIAPSVLGKRKA